MPTESELYEILDRYVQPRPLFAVCTLNPDGTNNFALFSHFMPVGTNPPTIAFCPARDEEGYQKQSLLNIRELGEFVACATTRVLASAVRGIGAIEVEKSLVVRPPRIAGSPLSLECRALSISELGVGPHGANFVVGEILEIHRDDRAQSAAGTIGGGKYIELSTLSSFEF